MNFLTKEILLDIIYVFLITGAWDIILRFMSEGKIKFFGIEKMKWVVVLKDYFEKHTVLSAFLLAAFVGAIAYYIISYLYKVIKLNLKTFNGKIIGMFIVFMVSGLLGLPMRYSGLFPVLVEHYYNPLGFTYSFITDAMSGIIVSITFTIFKIILSHYN